MPQTMHDNFVSMMLSPAGYQSSPVSCYAVSATTTKFILYFSLPFLKLCTCYSRFPDRSLNRPESSQMILAVPAAGGREFSFRNPDTDRQITGSVPIRDTPDAMKTKSADIPWSLHSSWLITECIYRFYHPPFIVLSFSDKYTNI